MPVHNWSNIEAGIFHHFHHAWIEELTRSLNRSVLPPDHYALAEQMAGGLGPDVVTLQDLAADGGERYSEHPDAEQTTALAEPQVAITAQTRMDFYRRKQSSITIRHVSGDSVVAVIEIVSPGNKSKTFAMQKFAEKAAELIGQDIHLLIVDVNLPTKRDPNGVHGEIWELLDGSTYTAPPDKPLTMVSYEAADEVKAYIEPVAVGDTLIDMPLFLRRRRHVLVPMEQTYMNAIDVMPRRWRDVLEKGE